MAKKKIWKNPIKTSQLSYEKQENIMNKIKEFLNPLNEELSNTSRETEEKISLTYNTKSGCQISLEKSNGELETFLDFTKENSNDVNGLSSKNFDSSDTSLLGGHKKKSKSQEREAKRRKRTAKLNNLSEDDLIQKKADERARKKDYYEKNKSEILSSRQTHYETNKSDILSSRQTHYETNKSDILSVKQNYYETNKDDILSARKDHYEKKNSDILSAKQTHYETNKSDILSAKQSHYIKNKDKILSRKRQFNSEKRKSAAKSTAKRYKGAKAHRKKLRLAKNLKLTTVRMHDLSYQINRQDIIAKYRDFYDLIKYGPDFICNVCHRSLFENQVRPLSKALNTKVKIGKTQYECGTNKKSFDGKVYICDACYTNLRIGKNAQICSGQW